MAVTYTYLQLYLYLQFFLPHFCQSFFAFYLISADLFLIFVNFPIFLSTVSHLIFFSLYHISVDLFLISVNFPSSLSISICQLSSLSIYFFLYLSHFRIPFLVSSFKSFFFLSLFYMSLFSGSLFFALSISVPSRFLFFLIKYNFVLCISFLSFSILYIPFMSKQNFSLIYFHLKYPYLRFNPLLAVVYNLQRPVVKTVYTPAAKKMLNCSQQQWAVWAVLFPYNYINMCAL